MAILDTNIIVRYLTRDDADKAARALAYFQSLEIGQDSVSLSEGVLVETIQVLSSPRLYRMSREDIRARIGTIVALRGVRMSSKRLYLRALELYETHPRLSFVDALCVAQAERESSPTVVSFDQDFDRVPQIRRREP